MQTNDLVDISNREPEAAKEDTAKKGGGLMRQGMMICCLLMLLPVGLYLVGGGSVSGLFANAGLLLPLAICGGMHFVMHRMMGKSCHGNSKANDKNVKPDEPAEIPAIITR